MLEVLLARCLSGQPQQGADQPRLPWDIAIHIVQQALANWPIPCEELELEGFVYQLAMGDSWGLRGETVVFPESFGDESCGDDLGEFAVMGLITAINGWSLEQGRFLVVASYDGELDLEQGDWEINDTALREIIRRYRENGELRRRLGRAFLTTPTPSRKPRPPPPPPQDPPPAAPSPSRRSVIIIIIISPPTPSTWYRGIGTTGARVLVGDDESTTARVWFLNPVVVFDDDDDDEAVLLLLLLLLPPPPPLPPATFPPTSASISVAPAGYLLLSHGSQHGQRFCPHSRKVFSRTDRCRGCHHPIRRAWASKSSAWYGPVGLASVTGPPVMGQRR